jgi:hypothetical protein
MLTTADTNILAHVYEESKFWSALIGMLWAAFKGFSWIKDIREKDLKGIQGDVSLLSGEVRRQTDVISTVTDRQTNAMTRELQELRSDFRTFYTAPDALMVPVHARGIRKRANATAHAKVKAKAKTKVKTKPTVAKAK